MTGQTLRARKVPKQQRSVETRERILDAARVVFADHGYSAVTNRIAERAGLSIGSLYQYYPNKDSILVELVRRHISEGRELVLSTIGQWEPARDPAGSVPLEQLVPVVVRAFVDLHAEDRRLHRVLFEESPRPAAVLADLHDAEDTTTAIVADMVAVARPDVADPAFTARILVVAIESLVHRLVTTDHPLDTDRVTAEISTLAIGYLRSAG